MRTLVLHIPKDASGPTAWALFDAAQGVSARSGAVEAGAALGLDVAVDRCWVLVSGAAVTTHTVVLPAEANPRKIAAAAAFALEDDLADDPADLHFALGGPTGDKRRVAVASHDVMGLWVSRIAALGLRADLLVPDYLVISKSPAAYDGLVLAKSDTGGFAAEADLAGYLLESAPDAPLHLSAAGLLQDAYAALQTAVPVNLLQGRYAPRRDWAALARPWRRVGMLAASVTLAALAGLAIEGARLNYQAEATTARAETAFRAALPEVKRVVNPRAQMRAYLQSANLSGSAGFLALSEVLVGAASVVQDAEITTLRFDGKRGEIAATFSLPSFEAVERVKGELTSRGGLVQEGGARQDGSRILADMTVKQR